MKKIFTSLLLTALCVPAMLQAQNVLKNGSFEQGLSTGWNHIIDSSLAAGAKGSFSLEKTDVKQGANALKVIVTKAGGEPYHVQSLNKYYPKVSKDYTISFFAKSTQGGSIRTVNQQPYSGHLIPALTADWKQYTYNYNTTNDTLEFAFNFITAGTYLIDSITIVPVVVVPPKVQKDSLKMLAAKCGLNFGTAVRDGSYQTEEFYKSTLKQHFNMVTAENSMKMETIKNTKTGPYNFAPGDTLVKFAMANKMKVRGHALLWHSQAPKWVTDSAWTNEGLFAFLKTYVTTVVGHYKGQIAEWDVVNEAFSDTVNNPFRTSYFSKLGLPIYDSVFKWAHQADPNALLFYNDYETEQMNTKSDRVFELVKGLVDRKAPIHGVGFQTHKKVTETSSLYTQIDQNIKRLGALGLKVSFTEIDVRMLIKSRDYIQQSHVYAELLRVALKNPTIVKSFVLWGVTDKYSWIPQVFTANGGEGDALIFDTTYNAKPAYDSLVAVLKTNCLKVTSVDNQTSVETISAYPNPFANSTSIQFAGQFNYTIYDARGTQVSQGKGNDSAEIGTELPAGFYSVKINNNAVIKTVKIIKADK